MSIVTRIADEHVLSGINLLQLVSQIDVHTFSVNATHVVVTRRD